jgi:tetratricopeptide (TPR) repeat protein
LYDLRADALERDNLLLKDEGQAREWEAELARFVRDHRPDGESGTRPALGPAEKERLESLGYVSSAAASARAGLDPKIGIVYQNRIAELVAALDRGETDRVEREAEGLIAETRDLKLPYAYTLLGLVYEKKRDWPRLRDHLLRAIETFGDEPAQAEKFRGNLLELYLAGGQYGPAEELARDILAHDPRQARPLEILGEIRESHEDWVGALDQYLRARESETGNVSLGRRVLKMRLKLGDHKAAAAEIESLLSTEDGAADVDLLFTAAMLRVEAGDGPGAEELLRRVTELKPSAKSYFDYALVLGRNGKVGPAAASMEKALAFVPNDLDAEMREAAAKALRLWRERPR